MSFNFGGSTNFGASNTGGGGFSFGSNNNTGGAFGSNTNTGGAFGSSTGFGSNTNTGGAFGSNTNTGNAFGSNTGFGSNTNTGGAFGSNTNTGGAFGSSNTFGSNTAFGGGSNTGGAFGSNTNTGGNAFGSNTNTGFGSSNAFGGTTNTGNTGFGGFGATNTNTGGNTGFVGGFGTSNTGGGGGIFGNNNNTNTTTSGPLNIKFEPYSDSRNGVKLMCITGQPAYQDKSLEEMRWYVYSNGQSMGGNQPASNTFGGTTNTGGVFGSNTGGGFGTTNTGGGFGSTNTGGAFGSSNTGGGAFGGGFGSTNTTGGTGFGTSNTGGTGFNFGNTTTSNTNTGFGASNTGFGATNTGTTGGGFNFGSNTNTTSNTGGGGFNFGQTSNTTNTGGFGNTGGTNTGGFNFGSNTNTTSNTGGGGFNFGQSSNTGATNTGFGATNTGATGGGFNFGQTSNTGATNTGFGATNTGATGGGFNFGQNTNTNQPSTGGFNFGNTSTNQPSTSTGSFNFGSTGNTGATTGTGSFNFGSTSTNQPSTNTGGFNFGSSSNTGATTGGGFNFGQNTNTNQPSTGGFNFGNTSTNQPSTGGSSFNFGNTATTTNTNQPSGSTFNFGNTATTNQPSTGGFNFGSTNTGLFNSAASTTNTAPQFGVNPAAMAAMNMQLPGVDTDPYGDSTSGFQNVLQRSTSEASRVERDVVPAHERPAVRSRRTPARILSARPLVQDRLSLFGATDEEEGLETEDLTDTYGSDVRSLVINDESYITLPPIEEDQESNENNRAPTASPADIAAAETQIRDSREAASSGADRSSQNNNEAARDANEPSTRREETGTTVPSPSPAEPVQRPTPRRNTTSRRPTPPSLSPDSESESASTPAPSRESVPSFAPLLTRPGYKTSPPYRQLCQLSSSELTHVRNFQIYNEHGSILWIGETNIMGLDLDRLVFIKPRFIEVYPDSSEKPARGRGLNKRALVTLNNIRPHRRTSIEDYETYLRRVTTREDATFVEYDAEHHKWVFEVQHFSRYGLLDDDQDEEEASRARKKQRIEETTKRTQPSPSQDTEQTPFAPEKSSAAADEQQPIFLPVAHELGLNPYRMHSMRSNLFADTDEAEMQERTEEQEATTSDNFDTSHRPTGVLPVYPGLHRASGGAVAPNFRQPFRYSKIQQKEVTPSTETRPQQLFVVPSNVSSSYRVPQNPTPIQSQVEPADSLSHMKERSSDAAIFLGRSFRVCFGPGGQIVVPQANGSRVAIHHINVHKAAPASEQNLKEQHTQLIETFFSDSTSEVPASANHSINEAPTVRIDKKGVLKVVDRLLKEPLSRSDEQLSQLQTSIWKLIHALWGDDHVASNGTPDEAVKRRRQLFSLWLQDEVRGQIESECLRLKHSGVSHLTQIFSRLTGLQLPESIELALKEQDYILGSFLSQAASEGRIHEDLRNQLSTWEQDESSKDIEEKRYTLYRLLAGDVRDTFRYFSNSPGVKCDWRRNFGVHLWYTAAAGGGQLSVSQVLDEYESCIHSRKALFPSPLYSAGQEDNSHDTRSKPRDIRYWIIRKFWHDNSTKLEDILLPINMSANCMDYRMSWALYLILSALSNTEEQNLLSLSSHVHSNFIHQLETLGLYREAIYIALHFESNQRNSATRTLFLKNLVCRYIGMGELSSEEDQEFLRILHIPQQWIEHAKAVLSLYNENYLLAAQHFTEAAEYEEAHCIIVKYLAPKYILCEKYTQLAELLGKLEPHQESLQNWEHRGRVYYLYSRNIDTVDIFDAQEGLSQWQFESPDNADLEHAAIAQMSTNIASLLLANAGAAQQDPEQMTDESETNLETYLLNTLTNDRLYLPEQFRSSLTLQVTQQFLQSSVGSM